MAKTNLAPDEKNKEDKENKNKLVDDLELSSESTGEDEKNNKPEENNELGEEGVVISKSKMAMIQNLLLNIKESNEKLIQLLSGFISAEDEARIGISQMSDGDFDNSEVIQKEGLGEGKIIEGVFDGENMIGPDGKQYSVPANYASKSKLVEGDILKLAITSNGTFVYKQIGPIERIRLIGQLEQTSNGNFVVTADGKKLRVLTASVTYFKGRVDDEVIILVPKTGESKWAAIENIVKKVE